MTPGITVGAPPRSRDGAAARMRVLLLATKYFGVGGAEAYTRAYADAFAANGAEVEVLSFLDGEVSDRTSAAPIWDTRASAPPRRRSCGL